MGVINTSENQPSLVRQIEPHVVSSGSQPRLRVEPSVRSGRARERPRSGRQAKPNIVLRPSRAIEATAAIMLCSASRWW